jgi:hypothetical protein
MQFAMPATLMRAVLAGRRAPAILILGLLASGCSHYQLGTEARLPFSTLYVEPVGNRTTLPQAQAIVSTQLRDAFEKDARVTLVNSPEAADATLTVIITDYHREVAAVREVDTGLASKFNLTLGVVCALTNNRAHSAFFQNRTVTVTRNAFTDNGVPASSAVGNQLQSEYNTLPLLAQQLADKVSHTVLDVW